MKKVTIAIMLGLVIGAVGLGSVLVSKKFEESGKPFKDVHVIFFNGGTKGDSFSAVVYKGAKAAERDLGCSVEYVWSDWDPSKMALDFKESVAKSPDAICMMGHPGARILAPLMDEAIRKGIIVTLQNVDLPEIRKQYIDKGFGYVGQEVYASGKMLAQGIVRKFNLGKEDGALVVGPGLAEDGTATNERAMRAKGAIDGLKESGIEVISIPMPKEIDSDVKTYGVEYFRQLLAAHPGIKLLIVDHGAVTSAMSGILSRLGKKPGEIIVGGFDLSQDTVEGIRSGYVSVVHDQQPYLQGYLPVLQACLSKKYGFAGLYIDTGVGLIDKTNIEAVAGLAKKQIR